MQQLEPLHPLHQLNTLHWPIVRHLLQFAQRRLDDERLPQVAGSLTFTTVLALVPLLTIALAIFTTFPLFNTFRTSLEAYFVQSLMPKSIANTILENLNQFSSKATRLSAFGAVALMVTAIAMLGMIDRVFNDIWRVKKRRPWIKRLLVYWAVVTLGPLLIGISMTLTSHVFTATSGIVKSFPFVGGLFYTLTSIIFTTSAFSLLYLVVPNRFVEWRDAVWGGLVAAIAFEIAKRLFAAFITQFPTYKMVYGALAALPIFLVWIYVSWLIILGGAVIAASLPVVKHERWWHIPTPATAFVDAMSIIAVLIQARVDSSSAAVDADMIRSKTRLGFDESENLLEKMLDAGWVGRLTNERAIRSKWGKSIKVRINTWALIANPAKLTVADVYRLFMFSTSGNSPLAQYVENIIEQGLHQTLATHFSRTEGPS